MIAGNGAMATRIRETDWSTHSLGPIEGWPATLHAALTTCLAARSPMHLWWRPQAIVFYNDASIPWLGARHPTALGRPAAELMPGRWDELSSAVQRVFVEGVVVEAAGIAIVPLAGTGGGVEGVLCTFAIDRLSDELFSSLDHEARNPLHTLSAVSAALALRMPGELDSLAQPVRHLSRVIEDLLDLARLSRGTLALHRTAGELASILDHARELVMPTAEQRAAKLFVSTPRAGLRVLADPARLARALAHILEEAVRQAAPESHVTIEASRSPTGLQLSIRYEPAAIASGTDAGARRELLAHNLIELHGGILTERQVGGIRELAIALPAADDAELAGTELSPALHGNRVMLVEDDDANAQALKLLLEQFGYVVVLAHDAAVALQLATTFQPEVVLIDIGLPVLDGWEVARRLREKLGDVPVIAVTARSQPADMQHSLEAGFFDHLTKPFEVEQLRRCLDNLRSGLPSRLARGADATASPLR